MSDRALSGVDGPPACPFVAFEDERDERSSSPDHRHRCYAEIQPAPRALAHQEAYCLSSAFPVCPTFQDWARREAAQARSSGRVAAAPPAMSAIVNDDREPEDESDSPGLAAEDDDRAAAYVSADDQDEGEEWAGPSHDEEPIVHRNPPRDWAAPPPWATSGGGPPGNASTAPNAGSGRPRQQETAPDFLASREAQGLAGSAADRLASGSPASSARRGASSSPSAPASDELAGLVGAAGVGAAAVGSGRGEPPPLTRPPSGAYPTTTASGRRPTVSSTRSRAQQHDGPSWESAKRYEAYPAIKTRAGLPGIPRIAIWAGALGVAALALFFLPALLGFGGGGTGASPTPSTTAAVATASPSPTPIPEPTAETYTIKTGDTLSKIAKKFGLTVDELLAANKDTIKDADKIKVGQEIIIPVPTPDEVADPSAVTPTESPEP